MAVSVGSVHATGTLTYAQWQSPLTEHDHPFSSRAERYCSGAALMIGQTVHVRLWQTLPVLQMQADQSRSHSKDRTSGWAA